MIRPGVQNPHCTAPPSTKARCTSLGEPAGRSLRWSRSADRPPMRPARGRTTDEHVVDQHAARATLTLLARAFAADQAEPLAQHVQQALAEPGITNAVDTVDVQRVLLVVALRGLVIFCPARFPRCNGGSATARPVRKASAQEPHDSTEMAVPSVTGGSDHGRRSAGWPPPPSRRNERPRRPSRPPRRRVAGRADRRRRRRRPDRLAVPVWLASNRDGRTR